MFYEGTLQDGISTALQQSKQVVCFVADDDEESQLWETDFLIESSVKAALADKAVVLRLQAGSEEAGFLEALFPVPRKPTLVVIQNGQLREYIAAGTSKEEFLRRLRLALGGSTTQASTSGAESSSSNPQRTESTSTTITDQDYPTSPQVQALLSERAARLEADKKAKETAAKAEAAKRAQARKEASEMEEPAQPNIKAAESKHAELLRKKKQEARDERARILKRIEDDKLERREREAQERQARLLLSATQDADASPTQHSEPAIKLPARSQGGDHCNLQIRLLDGSTIRNRFPSNATLSKDIREWIDEARTDGDDPYTFRVLLTPLPNKPIEASEEAESLLELGLAPSATLVLVPNARVATAFSQTGGALQRAWAGLYAFIAMVLGLPALLFTGARQSGQGGNGRDGIPLEDMDAQGRAGQGQRIRGFQNPDDRRRDQQLYNGNSLNFEPRRNDDEERET